MSTKTLDFDVDHARHCVAQFGALYKDLAHARRLIAEERAAWSPNAVNNEQSRKIVRRFDRALSRIDKTLKAARGGEE